MFESPTACKEIAMDSIRFMDRLGSAALTIAVVSALLLFIPGLVRAAPLAHSGVEAVVMQ
ncbi:MAG: hypothetical protein R3F38_07705 [Gammaproteobacteria bacterium]